MTYFLHFFLTIPGVLEIQLDLCWFRVSPTLPNHLQLQLVFDQAAQAITSARSTLIAAEVVIISVEPLISAQPYIT